MADGFVIADPAAWKTAQESFIWAKQALAEASVPLMNSQIRELVSNFVEAEAALLALPAPDLEAVADKLSIIFDAETAMDDAESLAKLRCIGDIRRLQYEAIKE